MLRRYGWIGVDGWNIERKNDGKERRKEKRKRNEKSVANTCYADKTVLL